MKINDVPIQGADHIRIMLARLFAGSEDCVILDRDERHFLQTDGWSLEYKNPAGLYRATRSGFSQSELEAVFIDYYTGGNEYITLFQWEELPGFSDWEPEETDDRPPAKTLREKLRRLCGL
ncbi:MAG: hypothetical protein E7047_06935 [Lentisphaerae bacterium]|nr:hypothetical protein [Lentisphaerota bacterium]